MVVPKSRWVQKTRESVFFLLFLALFLVVGYWMVLVGMGIPWYPMVSHGIPWYPTLYLLWPTVVPVADPPTPAAKLCGSFPVRCSVPKNPPKPAQPWRNGITDKNLEPAVNHWSQLLSIPMFCIVLQWTSEQLQDKIYASQQAHFDPGDSPLVLRDFGALHISASIRVNGRTAGHMSSPSQSHWTGEWTCGQSCGKMRKEFYTKWKMLLFESEHAARRQHLEMETGPGHSKISTSRPLIFSCQFKAWQQQWSVQSINLGHLGQKVSETWTAVYWSILSCSCSFHFFPMFLKMQFLFKHLQTKPTATPPLVQPLFFGRNPPLLQVLGSTSHFPFWESEDKYPKWRQL